ncbi:uncharacterized protein B0H64DRAFT_226928 [Chaetomium fimeti]|uniref:Uncharacterized protein n=1 Tax=Chaetomium fimeti TaxID=1854472 RepID=A0AAE0HB51_9PEZI|nr:hypothetical protein B0H64DRAFT_226928 [Chaetomium fimeti]
MAAHPTTYPPVPREGIPIPNPPSKATPPTSTPTNPPPSPLPDTTQEPEVQRGRRRRRFPDDPILTITKHQPSSTTPRTPYRHPSSTDSSTFRGRVRHRSTSASIPLPPLFRTDSSTPTPIPIGTPTTRTPTRTPTSAANANANANAAGTMRYLRVVQIERERAPLRRRRRRSLSPSRSRSPAGLACCSFAGGDGGSGGSGVVGVGVGGGGAGRGVGVGSTGSGSGWRVWWWVFLGPVAVVAVRVVVRAVVVRVGAGLVPSAVERGRAPEDGGEVVVGWGDGLLRWGERQESGVGEVSRVVMRLMVSHDGCGDRIACQIHDPSPDFWSLEFRCYNVIVCL